MSVPAKIETWQMIEPGKLMRTSIDVPDLKAGEVLVEVAGCGVCHTDVGYFYDGVPTVTKPPLTLGHEIAGRVVAGVEGLIGKEVIIPAVLPCNNCPICASGRGNRCLKQAMPGNSLGIYGGFASHIPVPAEDLCVVHDRKGLPLEFLAVVADAITSPYQAAKRANIQDGDIVVITGATGGLGVYMTQIAASMGAKEVIAIARNKEKLERSLEFGATHTISTQDKSIKDVRDEFRAYSKSKKLPSYGIKIFECTGTKIGQEISLELLTFVSKLLIVGFGTSKSEFMFSRLMAFDAEVIGTWGCPPKYYPEVLQLVLDEKIKVAPFVDIRPMSQIEDAFKASHAGNLMKRIVLTPDF
ncbi:6-hydroxycyclohex-1-ene-1-carbonyl-CoA dehydrogenase [Pelotomaculum isophthalicicum JI]|uniref:alcohol dehydrogenase n=1 Tax=Pelotomaculum isophthalicicum JI TaxID=947010 RepID=A0A9X4H6G1_9FIRM|nr:6-hydroxycyclohex-1-ene-1-carbonyl-CoA dehydrogenase [Pelotomaculum isophthalicicum]MDF9408858.1 6-hydroxycyclohex-1-ene-1-carbonyl-CoA dehydrogenase [Pelotomaculum isophthalicicum JI]